jgi:ankyrin repeat protein
MKIRRKQMYFRKARVSICIVGMMALLLAVLAMLATVAIAGINEDLIKEIGSGDLPEVKRLLAKGADVNAKDRDGSTALMIASSLDKPEVVQLLLDEGADVNARNKNGLTALMLASKQGYRKVKELLIKAGAK